MVKVFSSICLAAAFLVSKVQSKANPITIHGHKLYDSVTGEYFAVKGIDYYPRPNAGDLDINNYDFFTDEHEDIWKPDIEHLAASGANAVRLYAVNPTLSHDKFMCALAEKGMYALVDLGANCKNCAILGSAYPNCYPSGLKTRGEMIISAFAKYDNVLAFSAGNEINHAAAGLGNAVEDNAPCQKKFIRDMREFIDSCSTLRNVPVGVVLADTDRTENAQYYNCRTNPDDKYENAEWYGLNVYLHCDGAIDKVEDAGGYQKLLEDFTSLNYSIPVMLTEFGCLNPSFPTESDYEGQRTWEQAEWLYTSDYREQFTGAFAFEYSTENANAKSDSPYPFKKPGAQNYGLGYFSPENCDHDEVPCVYKPMPNYHYLKEKYFAVDTSPESNMYEAKTQASRTSTSTCPSNFASLSSATWPSDGVTSLVCPVQPPTCTCPAPDNAICTFTLQNKNSQASSNGGSSSQPSGESSKSMSGVSASSELNSLASQGSANANTTTANSESSAAARVDNVLNIAVSTLVAAGAILMLA